MKEAENAAVYVAICSATAQVKTPTYPCKEDHI